jgi:hypothetical protein
VKFVSRGKNGGTRLDGHENQQPGKRQQKQIRLYYELDSYRGGDFS